MLISARTRMHDIVREYGDISADLEARGLRCNGPRWLRRLVRPLAMRVVTVQRAAILHGVPLERMLRMLDEVAVARRGEPPGGYDPLR